MARRMCSRDTWKHVGERAPEGTLVVSTKAKPDVMRFSTGWIIQKDRQENSNGKGKGEQH